MLTAPRPRAAQLSVEPLAAGPCDAAGLPLPLSCCSLCMPSKGPWASEMSPSLFIFSILTGQARSKLATGSARQTLLHSSLVSCQLSVVSAAQHSAGGPRASRSARRAAAQSPHPQYCARCMEAARRRRQASSLRAQCTTPPRRHHSPHLSTYSASAIAHTRTRAHSSSGAHIALCRRTPPLNIADGH
eukprot:scaffold36298_cov122-Isochrysis_galbana.AAC.5